MTTPATTPVSGEAPVGWETEAEWELEQRVFNAANRADVPADVRKTIGDLWQQYCLAASFPTTEPDHARG